MIVGPAEGLLQDAMEIDELLVRPHRDSTADPIESRRQNPLDDLTKYGPRAIGTGPVGLLQRVDQVPAIGCALALNRSMLDVQRVQLWTRTPPRAETLT